MQIKLKTKAAICVLVSILSLLLLVFCGLIMLGGDFFSWISRGFHYVYSFLFVRAFDIKTVLVISVVLITLAALIYWITVAIKSEKLQLYELAAPFTTVLMPFIILAAIRGRTLGIWQSDEKALVIIALVALIIYVIASCATLFYSYKTTIKRMKAEKTTPKKPMSRKSKIIVSVVGVVILLVGVYWSVIEFVLKDYRNIGVIQFRYIVEDEENSNGKPTPAYITGIKEVGYPEVFEVPNKLLGHPVVGIDAQAFMNLPKLKKVILPKTIEVIGDQAFAQCPLLTEVVVKGELKSVGNDILLDTGWLDIHSKDEFITFGNFLYKYNKKDLTDFILKSEDDKRIGEEESKYVYIPSGVNTFASGAFSNQQHLIGVEMPTISTSIEKSLFQNCVNLETVVLNNVTSIESDAFSGCYKLSSIDLKNVTFIGNAAFKSTAIETVSFNDNITSIGKSVFENCTKLSTINVPNNVTSIGDDAFAGDISLKHIKLSDNVREIGNRAFKGSGLVEFTFPKYVDTINNELFLDAKSLTKVVLPAVSQEENTGIVFIGNSSFKNTENLENIEFPKGEFIIYDSDGKPEKDDKGNIIKEVRETIRSIESSAFEGSGIKSVTIPKLLTELKKSTFKNCKKLEEVNFYDDGALTSVGTECFSGTTSLKNITLPKTIRVLYSDILSKSGVTEVHLPSNNSSFRTINSSFFKDCVNLIDLYMPKSITQIDQDAFMGCVNLENVYYDGTFKDWCGITFKNEYSNPMYYAKHFYVIEEDEDGNQNWVEVTSIRLPDSVKSIGNHQFYGFENVEELIIPSSVKTIGTKAFYGCNKMNIKCEILEDQIPNGWKDGWNLLDETEYLPVEWGYSVQ